MTADQIHENLLKVLASTVMNQATARSNATPFQNDPMGHAHAISHLAAQVTAIKICCRAAGIDEETIQAVLYAAAI